MKKLLIVLAFLAITPIASATLGNLILEIDGLPKYGPNDYGGMGQTATVKVIQTAPNPTGSGGEMGLSFEGEVIEVVNTTANPPGGFWLWGTDFGIKQSDAVGGISFAKIGSLSGGTYGVGSTDLLGGAYVSTVQFSFIVEGYTELIWSGVWDGVDMTGEVAAVVGIPEPIAIALLSIGTLFIRRRQKHYKMTTD